MKKVKRKQIDFGGTVEQVVRGDGSLGNYDDKLVVTLTANEDITSEPQSLVADKSVEEIVNAILNKKYVEWRLVLNNGTHMTLNLLSSENLVSNSSTRFNYRAFLYAIDRKNGDIIDITVNDLFLYSTNTGAHRITAVRKPFPVVTINGERLDLFEDYEINLFDGFYFSNAIQDYDGNWYGAVVIGNQVWLAENLRTTHFADGTSIDNANVGNKPTYIHVNNDSNNDKTFGLLYSWYTTQAGALLEGWHLGNPNTLIPYLRSQNRYKGSTAKSCAGTKHWIDTDVENTPGNDKINNNKTGFNAVPAGYGSGGFGSTCYLWTGGQYVSENSGEVVKIANTDVNISQYIRLSKHGHASIRCVSNLTPIQFRNWYIEQYGSLQHDIIEEVKLCVEITWSDLTTLINNNGLIPGTKYRITDYNTTTVQTNTSSANHAFDLIVTAIDVNKLSPKATAVLHSGDTYFTNAGADLSKWEIWYDVNNNTSKYAWADATNGKGVIYRMIDEFGNDCPYDFKNIKFLRNNEYVYTFTYKDLNNTSILVDYSLNGAKCYNNVIKAFNDSKRILNHITFLLNSLTDECHTNTFDCDCHDNALFDAKCNTFGKECNHNTILQHCNYNTIDSQFASNLLGSYFIGNTIGLSCYSNAFGNNTKYNNIGSNFKDNTIGNNFQSNAIINNVMHCTIGNYFVSSTIGSNCTFTAANYVKNLVVQANNVGFNLDSTDSSTINNEPVYIQNVFITEGCITDGETPIRVTVDRNTIYRTTVAKTSNGTLRIYNEYDPYNAEDIHALPDTTKYGATIALDFDDTYTEVTDTTNKNPVEEGWFERSGTDPDYVYTLTEDTTPVSGKTYYKGGTYIITATLKDQDGNTLGTPQVVDLPLESVVVDGSYNSTTQNVELVLKNGHSIAFSVADLVRGLQTEITLQNPLSADLLTNGTNNKVFSATDKTKLDNIESGAQVNVKSDWNQTNSSSDDYIKNKPTALSSFTNDVGYLTAADVSASIVWCNYTETDSINHTGTMSMTIAEMKTAIASGYIVCLLLGDLVYTLNSKATIAARFCCVQGPTVHSIAYYDSDNLWHCSSITLQENLVSGTNIKTINNTSILGSGNINIREIPAANESNNGKMLKVVNGEWTIVPITPAYHHAGTKIVAQLIPDLLIAENEGNVYNITDDGTTTDYFIEGSGFPIKAGDNVGIAKVEGGYKFDLLSGFIDTSGFALKSEMSITDGTGANADKATIQLKSGLTKQVLTQHQDISGKADKSEMVITPGTGDNADKVNIQLKSGTSVDVLKTHQDISGKADVNGNYPNMTVGLAQNLDDKVTVEEPFLFRPSPNFKGALGKSVRINEIKGRSSKWNQTGNCGNNNTFFTGSNTGSSVTTSGVIANFDAAEGTKELSIHNQFPDVHIYYVTFDYSTNKSCNLNVMTDSRTVEATSGYVRYEKYGVRPDQPDNNIDFTVSYDTEDVWSVEIKNLNVIDVTVIFGAGNEPATKADFQLWLATNVGFKTFYPYDRGSLLSVKLEEFESIGFNQWDEEWEVGGIDNIGINATSSSYIRSKNYINVIGSETYYLNSNNNITVYYYDCNKTFISSESITKNTTFAIPSNCCYIRFTVSGTTYNNNVNINLSSSRNGEYQPYWKRTIPFDVTKITGINPNTNVRELVFPNGMRSAGNAYDRIYSDGKVAKATVNIGSVNLGTLSWIGNTYSDSVWRFSASLDTKKAGINNIMCSAFETNEAPNNYTNPDSFAKDKTICGDSSNTYIRAIHHNITNNYDFTVAMRGVILYYELANPITYTDLQDENGEPIELPLITKAANGGTERLLPQNESSMEVIAPILNIEYQVDVEDRIARLEEIVEGYESGDAFKNARTGFIIDQRGTITDPDTMVSANYYISDRNIDRAFAGILKYEDIVNDDNYVSDNATKGSVNNNAISWIRKNAHCFVGKWNGSQMRLRQLSDTDKSKFSDGTDATSYITNAAAADSDTYDVWLKFKKDIYYRCFPIIPTGSTTPDNDLQLVVFCKDKPYNSEQWEKFDKNKLIGVYEGYAANNKAFSISGVKATNNITQTNSKAYARNRGTGFKLVDLQANNIVALMFYGVYSTLNSQAICGSGTYNYDGSNYCPKKTGLCNHLGVTDTDTVNGNSASPTVADIQAGYGTTIKSINFLCLENWWGDIYECMDDLQVMQARRPSSVATANPALYVDDYINDYIANHSGATGAIINLAGVDTLLTPTDIADSTKFAEDDRFISIRDINGTIVRIINTRLKATKGNIAKCNLGSHGDVVPKALGGSYNVNSYCDYGGVYYVGSVALRSASATHSYGGVAYLDLANGAGLSYSTIGFRLLFEGTPDNTTIVKDCDVW